MAESNITKEKKFKGSPGDLRIGVWNRLEPRPRSKDFSRDLSAPVSDALFMLSKQWLLGEFKGEDTGTAIMAKVEMKASPVTRFSKYNGGTVSYDENIPLEARVEAEKVPLDIKMYIQLSNNWRKRLKANGVPEAIYKAFLAVYSFYYPEPPNEDDPQQEAAQLRTGARLAHEDAIRSDEFRSNTLKAFSGKILDAPIFLSYVRAVVREEVNIILEEENLDQATRDIINTYHSHIKIAASELLEWFGQLFFQPEENSFAWDASRLEYQFKLATKDGTSAPGTDRTPIVAKEYYRGNPDWYAYEIGDPSHHSNLLEEPPLPNEEPQIIEKKLTLLSSPASFPGMPKNRYWAFENGKVNFSKMNVNTTDLASLVLAEFAFIFGNDWFLLPVKNPVGSLCGVESIVVTDCFGFKTKVLAANEASEKIEAQNWSMFNLSNSLDNDSTPDSRVFMPPVTYKTYEGKPVEKVAFIKDEMANLVWGIEQTIPGMFGEGIDAYQEFLKVKKLLELQNTSDNENVENVEATYDYYLMTSVPENWIPFRPVNVVSENSSEYKLKFQRSALLRNIQGVSDKSPVKPKGVLLTEISASYFIEEEEIPREGIQVYRAFQRTRWWNGKTVCWLGRKKQIGKGEGKSNLKFDSIL